MVSKETILEQFEGLGIEPSSEILDRCVHICKTHDISDPEEFVEQWIAFSLSNLNGAEPTIDYLNELERKEYCSIKKTQHQNTKLKAYDENIPIYNNKNEVNENDADIMDSYICKTPKRDKNVLIDEGGFSSSTYVQTPTNVNQSDGPNQTGKVVYSFGKSNLINEMFSIEKRLKLEIQQIPLNKNNKEFLSTEKYLVDKFNEKCLLEEIKFNEIGKLLYKKVIKPLFDNEENDINTTLADLDDLSIIDIPSQQDINCIGRICCDSDGRLNEASTLLIGFEEGKIHSARLNFSNLSSFSLFPGQIVLAKGRNPRAEQLYVNEIVTEIELKLPKPSNTIRNTISLIIASGPFSLQHNLEYEPFKTLLNYCKLHKPDVIILVGPFLDPDNDLIINGSMAEDFHEFFEKMIAGVIDVVGNEVQILIVSSSKDACSSFVYPTHPYALGQIQSNVKLLPDPSIISIDGFSIGITATDILKHLVDEELIRNPPQDKIKRIVNYLFNQQSFYPLNPPHLDVCYDSTLAAQFASLKVIPNMLIVPGEMKYFIRDINNCLVVNPGKLADSNTATFAKMIINPVSKPDEKLVDYIGCQIIKI